MNLSLSFGLTLAGVHPFATEFPGNEWPTATPSALGLGTRKTRAGSWGPWTVAFQTNQWDVGPGQILHLPTTWFTGDKLWLLFFRRRLLFLAAWRITANTVQNESDPRNRIEKWLNSVFHLGDE